MVADKKIFFKGLVLLILFFCVLGIIFAPVFHGKNGLQYLDDLYNAISKGSAYYIPDVAKTSEAFSGTSIQLSLSMPDGKQAEEAVALFKESNARTTIDRAVLTINGDLGAIIANCLADADDMYLNRDEAISKKYGYDGKRALYNWWHALKACEKELKKQKRFKEATVVALVMKKAVEPSYNYFGIESKKISGLFSGVGFSVLFSLVFYVIYTMWYGFSIMFMFEGWGMKLNH